MADLMWRWSLLLALQLLLGLTWLTHVARGAEPTDESAVVAKKSAAKAKNWNKLNYDDLDKKWEEGDDPEELEHDYDRIQKILMKKRPMINMNDGQSIKQAYDADPFIFSGGGMMVFADLTPKSPSGADWTKASVDMLAARYAQLLRTGSVTPTIYNLENNRLLINLDRSWQTKDLLGFLASQRELKTITVNSKTYTVKDLRKQYGVADDDDYDDDDDEEL